jgi:hypothetical protein
MRMDDMDDIYQTLREIFVATMYPFILFCVVFVAVFVVVEAVKKHGCHQHQEITKERVIYVLNVGCYVETPRGFERIKF